VRSLAQMADELRKYPVRFIWIYRDPVNVLYSMQQQKWIAPHDIDKPDHLFAWQRRNQYALEFHRQKPEQISIVRYEDLCVDPAVFAELSQWLGLNCQSLFQRDSGRGRKRVPYSAQRAIDARTARTLGSLNSARRFKAAWRYRFKSTVSRVRDRAVAGGASLGVVSSARRGQIAPMSAPALCPSALDGLCFWLDAAAICHCNGAISKPLPEMGPQRMLADQVENGPYCLLSLNLRGVLYYPLTKLADRRSQEPGTLSFGTGDHWNFFFNQSGFTVFALFRPNPPSDQASATFFG
jgi:hypothetical protein